MLTMARLGRKRGRPTKYHSLKQKERGVGSKLISCRSVDRCSLRRLAFRQECLRIFPLAAKLEAAEILVPVAIRRFWTTFPPLFQPIKVIKRDLPFAGTLEQMVTDREWQVIPKDFRHSASEDHPCQFLFGALHFLGIFR